MFSLIDNNIWVMSLEIRPLTELYPLPPIQKMCFIGLSVVAGGCMLMHTAFAPRPFVSVQKNIWWEWGGGGYNAAGGLF